MKYNVETVKDFIFNVFSQYTKINNEWLSDINERLSMSDMNDLLEEKIISISTSTREDGRILHEIYTESFEAYEE